MLEKCDHCGALLFENAPSLLSISVDAEKIREMLPAGASNSDFRLLLDHTVNAVKETYQALEPDDCYVHTDAIQIKRI